MTEPLPSRLAALERDGFVLLPAVFDQREAARLIAELEAALHLAVGEGESIRSSAGGVYAARNVLELYPPARRVWRRPALLEFLKAVLGPDCGLVRGLYFDKPPERTWSLPWHKDLTIAVRENHLPSTRFGKPTRKAGVPHVEAPPELLARMLTLRIHLDAITGDNGPLKVAPGSHCFGRDLVLDQAPPQSILSAAGDVLAMRPLLAHCSGQSTLGTSRHRRILHLEFAANPELPDGFAWQTFERAEV
ncbi:MAG: phytanoyl-CoA dioxygenase family protein [Pirellulales bacterium]